MKIGEAYAFKKIFPYYRAITSQIFIPDYLEMKFANGVTKITNKSTD